MLIDMQQWVSNKLLLNGEIRIHRVAHLGAKLLVHARATVGARIPSEVIKLNVVRYLRRRRAPHVQHESCGSYQYTGEKKGRPVQQHPIQRSIGDVVRNNGSNYQLE